MPGACNPEPRGLTRAGSRVRLLAASGLALLAVGCLHARRQMIPISARRSAAEALEEYRRWALAPSGLAPAGVDPGPLRAEAEGIAGSARWIRPEDQPWNQWGQARQPLLFNDRVALLFELDLEVEGEGRWVPGGTALEINRPELRVLAAPTADHVLADLVWYALEQERWALDGDLVQRSRQAGGFREAFVRSEPGAIRGVIAFARPAEAADLAALRLTVAVELDGEVRALVWVFQ